MTIDAVVTEKMKIASTTLGAQELVTEIRAHFASPFELVIRIAKDGAGALQRAPDFNAVRAAKGLRR
eukprot:13054268-Alexandrium_andersonii.AAC.1